MKIKNIFEYDPNANEIYFMSDLHYHHENIIKLSGRENFDSIDDMDSFIISELKRVIRPGDVVFDLGDMYWKKDIRVLKKIRESISCEEVHKIIGNHDYIFENKNACELFTTVSENLDIQIRKEGVIYRVNLCHYPKVSWYQKFRGALHLHGHCHGGIDSFNSESNDLRVDVGFDGELSKTTGSFLISFSKILEYFKNKIGNSISFSDYVINSCKNL